MDLHYVSTRDHLNRVTASEAILQGLASDGGLYVPEQLPRFDFKPKDLLGKTYQEIAYEVMRHFITDFSREELEACIKKAYDSKFDSREIAPLTYAEGAYYLELFHGKTIAFKDMALSILPHLMTTAARKKGVKRDIVILTATSGDTGKAAMAGFADVKGTRIIVFYPKDGVSPIQEKQMLTQTGDNTCVVGIHGNFDQAQSGVKRMLNDPDLAARIHAGGFQFSSANSINIGRLVPQIVYYVYAYVSLLENGRISEGEKINVVVPTGNFGNILAAYYAKRAGLPVAKLICASNENKVLCDFFASGTYDRNRPFKLTTSPSMDILISSNLERLIYEISGQSDVANAEFMEALRRDGVYRITDQMRERLGDFYGNYADEAQTGQTIRELYEACGYVIDTHTAVAASVYGKYKAKTGDETKTLIAATASPYKFLHDVMSAIDAKYAREKDFDLVRRLAEISGVPVPKAISEILTAPIRHDTVCETDQMDRMVCNFLGL